MAKDKIKVEDRFKIPLREKLEKEWKKVSGKKGGFVNDEEEKEMKELLKNLHSESQLLTRFFMILFSTKDNLTKERNFQKKIVIIKIQKKEELREDGCIMQR